MKTIQKSLAIGAALIGAVGYSAGSGAEAWTAKTVLIGLFLCAGMVYTMIRQPERITLPLVWLFGAPILGGLVAYEAVTGSTKVAILTLTVAVLFLGIQTAFVVLVSSRMASVSASNEDTEQAADGNAE